MKKSLWFTVFLLLLGSSSAQAADLDLAASKVTVRVEKSGLFAAFAHNHTISAPLATGQLDTQKRAVELKFRSQDMKVLDPGSSDSERATIESTMKSAQVLDTARFPEISFVSTSVETVDANRYLVHGNLTLHGVTKPVDLTLSLTEARYSGKATLKQTDFDITPVKIAGGTVRVKDKIEIIFEILPAK